MCYIRMTKEELDKRGRLRTIDEWIQIAEQLKEMGTLYILITGGEPFLYKDFKELYIKLYNNFYYEWFYSLLHSYNLCLY